MDKKQLKEFNKLLKMGWSELEAKKFIFGNDSDDDEIETEKEEINNVTTMEDINELIKELKFEPKEELKEVVELKEEENQYKFIEVRHPTLPWIKIKKMVKCN